MHVHMCVHVYMCVHVICSYPPRLTSFFTLLLKQALPLNMDHLFLLGLVASLLLGIPISASHVLGLREDPHTDPFDVGSGDLNSRPHSNQ